MARYAFIFNQRRCIGCNACVVACQQSYQLPKDNQLNWVSINEEGKHPNIKMEFKPMLCGQCENPPCVPACPVDKATYQREDGIVMVNDRRCIGCRACIGACPYGARSLNEHSKKVVKCIFCVQQLTNDSIPYCVNTCPSDARFIVDLDNLSDEDNKLLNKATKVEDRDGANPLVYHIK